MEFPYLLVMVKALDLEQPMRVRPGCLPGDLQHKHVRLHLAKDAHVDGQVVIGLVQGA